MTLLFSVNMNDLLCMQNPQYKEFSYLSELAEINVVVNNVEIFIVKFRHWPGILKNYFLINICCFFILGNIFIQRLLFYIRRWMF